MNGVLCETLQWRLARINYLCHFLNGWNPIGFNCIAVPCRWPMLVLLPDNNDEGFTTVLMILQRCSHWLMCVLGSQVQLCMSIHGKYTFQVKSIVVQALCFGSALVQLLMFSSESSFLEIRSRAARLVEPWTLMPSNSLSFRLSASSESLSSEVPIILLWERQ